MCSELLNCIKYDVTCLRVTVHTEMPLHTCTCNVGSMNLDQKYQGTFKNIFVKKNVVSNIFSLI